MSPSDTSPTKEPDTLDESSVVRFLETHPDFFANRDQLLMSLRLPQPRGAAISLMDRQVALLRERNVENRRLIEDFKRNALRNEEVFQSTKTLVLALIAAEDAEAFYAALSIGLRDELGFSVSLLFIGEESTSINDVAHFTRSEDMPGYYTTHFDTQTTYMGPLREEERSWLFPMEANETPSSAVVIMLEQDPMTLLALGHPEPGYFNSQLETTLLTLVTDALAALLPRFRPSTFRE